MTLTNYWWLLIWLFTGGLALTAYFPKHREMVCGKVEIRWGVVPAVLMAVPYIVWAGYRSDAFGDTAAYRGAFKDAPSSFSEMSAYLDTIMKDKGFYGLVAALKSLFHVSDIGCFMLLAGFQLLVIVWLYRKYSSFYWFSFFLFIASTDYMSWAQNGVRQFLAVTIVSMVTSGIFIGRLPIYASLYSYILLPWEIEHIFMRKSARLVTVAAVVAYCGFFYYQMRFTWGLV